jgi:hypothetical protein
MLPKEPTLKSVALALVALLANLAPHQAISDSPQRVEYCDLVNNPAQFASKMVIVQARLKELKRGEWGLDSHCFQPMLLAFPDDVRPKPNFQLEKTEGIRLMQQARREQRVLFRGDFVGRFDLAKPLSQAPGDRTRATFGKSNVTMRLLLRDVQNPERIVIPGSESTFATKASLSC